ncbi:tetratricopeptide repeat protein 24-like [Ambystoma mexicanum]|uniref:tetratricopeptide repeat protein 24-like n=1 Tax=Ambystoma mexicanum TaxID=8296 RepID=UPI0037E7735C
MAPIMNSKSEGLSGNQTLATQAEIEKLSKAAVQYFTADDISLALSKFKKAYLLSSNLPEKRAQKVCLFNLGAAYISADKPKKGLKCLIKSLTKGYTKNYGDLFFNIGAAYDVMKDHDKAIKFYQKALNEYETDDIGNIAETLIKIGYAFAATGNLHSASQTFKYAGASYQKMERTAEAAMALREAANYMIRSRESPIKDVLQTLHDCEKLCDGITDKCLLCKLYNHLGIHYAELKYFGEAATCIKKSIRLCSGTNYSTQKMAVLLQNSGAVENSLGQYEISLASHMVAADTFGDLGDSNRQGQCLCNLAYAFSQLEKYDKAEFYYQQALRAFTDAGELRGQWVAVEGMAASQFRLGDTDQAIDSYKQAVEVFVKAKETSEIWRERLLRKLTDAIEYGASQKHPESPGRTPTPTESIREEPSEDDKGQKTTENKDEVTKASPPVVRFVCSPVCCSFQDQRPPPTIPKKEDLPTTSTVPLASPGLSSLKPSIVHPKQQPTESQNADEDESTMSSDSEDHESDQEEADIRPETTKSKMCSIS